MAKVKRTERNPKFDLGYDPVCRNQEDLLIALESPAGGRVWTIFWEYEGHAYDTVIVTDPDGESTFELKRRLALACLMNIDKATEITITGYDFLGYEKGE